MYTYSAVLCLQANMVDGLYSDFESLRGDLATVTYRIQLLGFNAVRIPFSFLVRTSDKLLANPCFTCTAARWSLS